MPDLGPQSSVVAGCLLLVPLNCKETLASCPLWSSLGGGQSQTCWPSSSQWRLHVQVFFWRAWWAQVLRTSSTRESWGSSLWGEPREGALGQRLGGGAVLTVPPACAPSSSALLGTTSDLSHAIQLSPTPYLCSESYFINVLKLKFYFTLECSQFTMLCYLQMYSKVIQLFVYPLPFRLFPI